MFIYIRLFIFFHMLIDSSFKMTTGFTNVIWITSCTNKFINKKRIQKIGCFIYSWRIVINFKRSKNNFKISIFPDFRQLFLKWPWIFFNIWKFVKTCFIRFWIRWITTTMHFVQIRKMVEKNYKRFFEDSKN